MARSNLLGPDHVPPTHTGSDSAALGPSDSTDSGSDVANLDYFEQDDPGMPVDAAGMNDDRPVTSHETVGPGIDSDAAGTGERRSAAGDAGERDAPDIEVDQIVQLDAPLADEADPEARRQARAGMAGKPAEGDDLVDEDEEEDDEGR